MTLHRRNFLRVAAAASFAAAPGIARADTYPTRPVRLVLPFPPGGVFDIVGRPWADKVSKSGMLGTVFIENQPGAGGSLAGAAVAHATPDGYTILMTSTAVNMTDMILRDHPLLDPMKDLEMASMLATTGFAIAVNPDVPAKNLKELIDYVKANPGKMSYGTAGAGTMNHLSGEMLKSLTGITDLPHVPYRGAGPAIADAIAGQIPMIVPAMTSQVLEYHRTGKLRLLAVTNPARISIASDIPTCIEADVPGLYAEQVMGLFVPAGTPKDIVVQIGAANRSAVADAAYQKSLVEAAVIPVTTDWSQDKYRAFMAEEVARWSPLVKAIGVKLD